MTRVGLDIGGSSIKAVAMDPSGGVRVWQSQRYVRPDRAGLMAEMAQVAPGLDLGADEVESVGICVPGIRSDDGSCVTHSVNVPGLESMSIEALVGAAMTRKVYWCVVSDALAAAQDAVHRQRLSGRVVGISIGTGVGMAVLDDGVPIRHTDAGAGHLGQIDVRQSAEPPIGPDGGRGGLEAYIGSPALRRRFGLTDRAVLEGLKTDPAPLQALAQAIRIVHAMYRPQTVSLLGGLGIRLAGFRLRDEINRGLTSLADPAWTLEFGLDDYHAARGAAMMSASPGAESAGS